VTCKSAAAARSPCRFGWLTTRGTSASGQLHTCCARSTLSGASALTQNQLTAVLRAVQVCNRPYADVPRVVCLPNLQGLIADAAAAAAADMHFARHTILQYHFKRAKG